MTARVTKKAKAQGRALISAGDERRKASRTRTPRVAAPEAGTAPCPAVTETWVDLVRQQGENIARNPEATPAARRYSDWVKDNIHKFRVDLPEQNDQPTKEPAEMKYSDVYPTDDGPPNLRPGHSGEVFERRHPVHEVVLDEGAFQAVWRLVEKEAERVFPVNSTLSDAAALLRAVADFRVVRGQVDEEPQGDDTEEVEATTHTEAPPRTGARRLKARRSESPRQDNRHARRPRSGAQGAAEAPKAGGLSHDASKVLQYLGAEPRGKAEVLALSGLEANAWVPAIRELLEGGKVVQHGAKKGAKYTINKRSKA